MNRMRFKSFSLVVIMAISIQLLMVMGKTAAAVPGVSLEIPEKVSVSGPQIYLSDLGVVRGDLTADSQSLNRINLGQAPVPGQVRIFTREYLAFILQQYSVGAGINLKMGTQVEVRTDAVSISGKQIEQAIQKLVPIQPDLLKRWVEFRAGVHDVWVSKGDWKIGVTSLGILPRVGTALFKINLTNDAQSKVINISGRIRAIARVYRTVKNIDRLAEVRKTDFESLEMELITGKELLGEIPENYRTTKVIKQGEILRADYLQLIPLVHKDHEVTVIVRDNQLEIKSSGITKKDGWMGDEIVITNPISKKTYRGRVIAPDTVEVRLR